MDFSLDSHAACAAHGSQVAALAPASLYSRGIPLDDPMVEKYHGGILSATLVIDCGFEQISMHAGQFLCTVHG